MATVVLNDRIRQEICHNATRAFTNQREKNMKLIGDSGLGMQAFMAVVDQEELAIAKELNNHTSWVPTVDVVWVTVGYTNHEQQLSKRTFSVPLGQKTPVPTAFQLHYHTPIHVDTSLPCYQFCAETLRECERLEQEKDELHSKLMDLLNSCKTLNQAIRRWPSILECVPDEVKEKHLLKTNHNKRKPIEVDDQTKTLLVKARILNST